MTFIPIPLTDLYDYPDPQTARFGLGTKLTGVPTRNMEMLLGSYAQDVNGRNKKRTRIPDLEHPLYKMRLREWEKWRTVYDAGELFISEYLNRFSNRENPVDFTKRKALTPIPAFATSAINEIKNSVFQRIADTIRNGGGDSYRRAITGELGGVNLHGATMTWFIGRFLLSELLVMQKVGVYVDAPNYGITKAQKGNKHPYFCTYRAEDIKSWAYTTTEDGSGSEFSSILLREYTYDCCPVTGLPEEEEIRYRHVFLNPTTGRVNIQFFDCDGDMEGPVIELAITKIPFVVFEITESLMKNVANHQIALMNLGSSDISYALHSNFPFYVEQSDPKNRNPLTKTAQSAYEDYYAGAYPPGAATVASVTGMAPGSPITTPATQGTNQIVTPSAMTIATPAAENADVGATQGRRYPFGAEQPAFIAPPSAPLKVSMEKQKELKDDIRALVHLTLSSVQSKSVSAESKLVDREQGLESGLSAIGIELEHGERELAAHWAAYEGDEPPSINYPTRWSLKTSAEIQAEIKEWQAVRESVPSLTFKKEVNKLIVETVLGTKATIDLIDKMRQEVEDAKGGSSDPKVIASDIEQGILGPKTASALRGYPEDEVDNAQKYQAERLALVAMAQSQGKGLQHVALKEGEQQAQGAAARGLPDAAVNPALEAKTEKQGKAGRGEAK